MLKPHLIKTSVIAIALTLSSTAEALVVENGLDYLDTVSAIHPLPFGLWDFKGHKIVDPFDTNNFALVPPPWHQGVDTIVERIDDTVDLNPGDTDTIDIEMVALSLVSVDPVELGSSFFDIFITLDLGADFTPNTGDETSSTGTMDITLNATSDGGTFDSTMDVFADAFFVPVGINPMSISDIVTNASLILDIEILDLQATDCIWSTTGGVGLPHEGPNFYLSADSTCTHRSPNGDIHGVKGIPEPTTLALALTGLTLLGLRYKSRRL